MKKRHLFVSLMTLVLCLSLISGATFALFTSESKVNIAISSGKVEMVASVDGIETWSLEDNKATDGRTDGSFTQGGSVDFAEGKLTIDKIIPGDKVKFNIVGENNSNISVKYRVVIKALNGLDLVKGLIINIDNVEYKQLYSYTTAWKTLAAETDMNKVEVSIELPVEAGNEYQDLTTEFLVKVEAIQGNAEVEGGFEVVCFDIWNGEEDSEGLEENTDETAKVLKIESASQLAAFAAEVNAGNSYAGYNVTLEKDIYLDGKAWTPIGPNADANNKFKGTFDGQNHTIYDLYVEQGAAYHAAGLFGALNGTVKNLVIDGAQVSSISSGAATDNGTAVVAGSMYIKATIDNVKVYNATVNGNRYVGVIAGYAYGNITNCEVDNVKVTAQMDKLTGSLDNGDKVGGIVGYISGESVYKLSNNKVNNCELVGARDLGGIAGVMSSTFVEFENNKVTNTKIYYSLEKSYAVAGEIVSARTAVVIPASNTFENVTISKDGLLANPETAQTAIENANEGDTIILSNGQYDELVIQAANGASKKGLTIVGQEGAVVGFLNINGSSEITIKNLTFDANGAKMVSNGNGEEVQPANIGGANGSKNKKGAENIVIDGCNFIGEFVDGGGAIAFVDQNRTTGGSKNVTVSNCTFEQTGGYFGIYFYYSGNNGELVIENNVFTGNYYNPVYLGRYQSSVPVVVKGNAFKASADINAAVYLQAHSNAYSVSYTAENNTFK